MIQITDKKMCCGCMACASICLQDCISMTEDNEGFWYPLVDKDRCVECNLCETVCPILHASEVDENRNQRGFIVANKDTEILHQSTSGGAFTAIGEYVIGRGGIVYGVEMSDDFHVRHTAVCQSEELCRFRNSKYVQSDVGRTFAEVRAWLETGRLVCFSGTPCQIEGLLNYLCRKYDNLILVDVVCRAVPSPGVWRRYVRFLQKQHGKIQSIRFRDKTLGYQFSTMQITMEEGKVIRNGIESDTWLRMFFSGMIIRPSCACCKFRKRYRRSDITIWDCFNVSDITDTIDEKAGATRVLIHTDKGIKLFNEIQDQFHYIEVKPDILVEGMRELSVSPELHRQRDNFFKDYSRMEMKELMEKYYPIF